MGSDIICRTDGSCGKLNAGLGYHITGEVEASGSVTVEENITSMQAELYALLEGVRVASIRSDDRESITIYTDCRPLKRKICGSKNERIDWEEYRQSAMWLLNKFGEWEIIHTSRDMTTEAHKNAQTALDKGRNT